MNGWDREMKGMGRGKARDSMGKEGYLGERIGTMHCHPQEQIMAKPLTFANLNHSQHLFTLATDNSVGCLNTLNIKCVVCL